MAKIVDINFKDNNNWKQLLNLIYPIGSVYQTTKNTDPATIFGGTWVRIQGVFLLGQNSTYTAGSTGGEATHVLTPTETATKDHNHTVDHTHEHTISFTLGEHAAGTACSAGTTTFSISNHTATACTYGTAAKIVIAAHTLTQPTWNYTAPAHTHSIAGAYAKWNEDSGWIYYNEASGVTAWTATRGADCTDGYGSWSSYSTSYGVPIFGTSGSGGAGTANSAAASKSVDLAISNHSSTLTQPKFTAPKLTHSVSTQPVFSTPAMSHTVTKSGSVTAYSGNTGNTTEADGDAHNNMPPYLSVYIWKRTA